MGRLNRLRKQEMIKRREEALTDPEVAEQLEVEQLDKDLSKILYAVRLLRLKPQKDKMRGEILHLWYNNLVTGLTPLDESEQKKRVEYFANDMFKSKNFTELCQRLSITSDDLMIMGDEVLKTVSNN